MSSMLELPPENRLQILAQLPLSCLLTLQFLSRDLFNDVHALFSSRTFVFSLLDRLSESLLIIHGDLVTQFLRQQPQPQQHHHHHHKLDHGTDAHDQSGSTNAQQVDEPNQLVQTMFVLLHLMKHVSHLKHKMEHQHSCTRREEKDTTLIVLDVVKRCKSAARRCSHGAGNTLWSAELKRMLYPQSEEYSFLNV